MTRAVKWLMIVTVTAFVLQVIGRPTLGHLKLFDGERAIAALPIYVVDGYLGISWEFVRHGCVWQFATYMFLHGDVWHILMNMLMLFFLGPDVERAIGSRRFLLLYLGCGIIGGAGWLLLSSHGIMPCIGASGAVLGVLGAFAALFPRREITLLIFFVLPVTMTARVLAIGLAAVSFFSLFGTQAGGIAHAAHLAGGLAGYLYAARLARLYAFGLYDSYTDDMAGENVHRLGWLTRIKNRVAAALPRRKTEMEAKEEVDRVLDKMIAGGYGSLSRREREVLNRASGKK
jgi:membrane associated rhomboid family serine protease